MRNLSFPVILLLFQSTIYVYCIPKDFTGYIYQACPSQNSLNSPAATNKKFFQCKQNFNVLDTSHNATECGSKSSIANQVMKALNKASPSCFVLYMELVNVSSGEKTQFRRSKNYVDACPEDQLEIQLADECVLQLTQEEKDFQQLCKTSNVSMENGECTCNMFTIAQGDSTYDLCAVFQFSQHQTRLYGNLNIKNENAKYKTILQRSCLYLNQTNNCECESIQIMKGNLTFNFCTLNSFESLCKFFRIPMNECSCAMFNNGENNGSVCDFLKPGEVEKELVYDERYLVPYAAVETVASVIGIIGNLLVVSIAIRFRRGLATCKRLIANLAFNDFYFAIFQLIYAVPKFWTSRFIYGVFMCKMLKSVDYFGTFLAIGIILTISIERFNGIVNPFSRGISNKGIQAILIVNFVLGLSSAMPLFYYNNVNSIDVCKTDWPNKHDSLVYHLFLVCAYLVVPTIVIATLYSLIVSTLHGTIIVGKENFIADPRVRMKRLKDNRRTMYVLIGVVVAFVLLVFPKHMIMLYMDAHGWGSQVNEKEMSMGNFFLFQYIALFSYPFHVAINPIIYSLIDARWRKDVRHFFNRNSWRKRTATSGTTNSTLTATQRRRSSAATILDEAANNSSNNNIKGKRESSPRNLKIIGVNLSNNLTTNDSGEKSYTTPLPTPTGCNDIWMGEKRTTGTAFTFKAYSET